MWLHCGGDQVDFYLLLFACVRRCGDVRFGLQMGLGEMGTGSSDPDAMSNERLEVEERAGREAMIIVKSGTTYRAAPFQWGEIAEESGVEGPQVEDFPFVCLFTDLRKY
jgi:hypothetical protein